MLKNINEDNWVKYTKLIPYKLDDIFIKFAIMELNISQVKKEEDAYINVDEYMRLHNCISWAGLLEKDMKNLYLSLIYCAFFGEDVSNIDNYKFDYNFEFYFDVVIIKFVSSLDRFAQLLNEYFKLGFDVNYQGGQNPSVSFYRVINKIKYTKTYDSIRKLLNHPRFNEYLNIRINIIHSYHVWGSEHWIEKIKNKDGSVNICSVGQYDYTELKDTIIDLPDFFMLYQTVISEVLILIRDEIYNSKLIYSKTELD